MHYFFQDLTDLLSKLFTQWITLASGVASVLLTLWEKKKKGGVGFQSYMAILSICMLPAFFVAWHDLKDTIRAEQSANQRLEAQAGHQASDSANLARAAENTHSVDRKADNFKKETSDNPQKELSNLGVPWTDQAFTDALLRNDLKILRLFASGGFSFLAKAPEAGNALGLWIATGDMRDRAKIREILNLYEEAHVNLLDPVAEFRGFPRASVAVTAARSCNLVLVREMMTRGATTALIHDEFEKVFPGQSPFSPSDGQSDCQDSGPAIVNDLGLKK